MSNEIIQTHWAVLIGVGISVSTQADTLGNHGSVTREQSLKGSIPDIEMMESYFQSSPEVKISKLTATKSKEKDSNAPIEPPELWPTRKNLVALLTSIIKESASRRLEHVYIHFSGHGSRRKSDGSLELSLFHLPERRHELLPTEILASALKAMSQQGVHVTLVLDCCYAGAVRRSSDEQELQVRFIECSPEDDFGDDADYRVLRDAIAEVETSRGLILSRKDILEPEGYLVITACGPTERAQEIQHGSQRNGALTYFLHSSLVLLQRLGENISFQTLYDRLHGMFHVNYPHQTPRHYGSLTKSFFQDLSSPLVHDLVTVVKVSRENRFILQAGRIHGVHLGDEYLAYPYHSSETEDPESVEDSIRFNVVSLDNTHSTVATDDITRIRSVKEISSWKARLTTSKSDQRTQIHLSTSLTHEERRSLQENSLSHPLMKTSTLESESGTAVFVADVNSDGLFEIHKRSSDCIPNLPKLPRKNEESLQVLSDALGHLAAYNFFESITNGNPESQFGEGLSIECSIDMGPDGWYDIADGTNFTFSLHNKCKRPLFMAVFNLRSTWEITNLLAEAAQGSYCEIPNQEEKITFPLQPERSDTDDGSQSEDIIKIFVTDQAPSFPFLVLPALGKSRHRDHAGPEKLLDFVKRMEGGYRQGQNEEKKRWMTRNFYLRVS